jgi:hypothetical protein
MDKKDGSEDGRCRGPRIMSKDRLSAAVTSSVLSVQLQNGNVVCTDGLTNRPTKPDEIWKN